MAVTEQTITIGYADIKSKVKKHFSIIGKRLSDKQGNILFTGVTLSSTEEDILKQYVKDDGMGNSKQIGNLNLFLQRSQ